MKTPHERAVETRRLYWFEHHSEALSKYSSASRSQRLLRQLALKVWEKHGRARERCPDVRVVDGAPWSYCEGRSKIRLATARATRSHRPHNTVDVLLHEIAHAMGYGAPHGKAFVRKYIDLLVEYGRCDRGALMLDAEMFKL